MHTNCHSNERVQLFSEGSGLCPADTRRLRRGGFGLCPATEPGLRCTGRRLLPARLPSHMWPVSSAWRLGAPQPRALASGGPLLPSDSPCSQTRAAWAPLTAVSMVLKPSPSGEACVAIDRRKGNSAPCGREVSHAWYAGPTCKNCYIRASSAGRKSQKGGASEQGEDISGGDILLEVLKVCGSRCPRPATPHPLSPVPC